MFSMIGFSVFPLFCGYQHINETLGCIALCSPGQDQFHPSQGPCVEEDFYPLLFSLSPLLASRDFLLLDPVDPHPLFLHVFTGLLVEVGLSRIGFVVSNAH